MKHNVKAELATIAAKAFLAHIETPECTGFMDYCETCEALIKAMWEAKELLTPCAR